MDTVVQFENRRICFDEIEKACFSQAFRETVYQRYEIGG